MKIQVNHKNSDVKIAINYPILEGRFHIITYYKVCKIHSGQITRCETFLDRQLYYTLLFVLSCIYNSIFSSHFRLDGALYCKI